MSDRTSWTSSGRPDLMDDDGWQPCTAMSKGSGERCKRAPVVGLRVCSIHGGRSPKAVAKAARKRAAIEIEAALITYGLPVEISAEDALYEELYRSVGHVRWLQSRVQALAPEALIWGETVTVVANKEATEFPGVDVTKTESAAVHVWLDLYSRERRHMVDVADKIARLNLEERRVRIDEQKATVLTDVLRAVLAEHGLKLGDEQVAADVRRHLRLVTRAPDESA